MTYVLTHTNRIENVGVLWVSLSKIRAYVLAAVNVTSSVPGPQHLAIQTPAEWGPLSVIQVIKTRVGTTNHCMSSMATNTTAAAAFAPSAAVVAA